MAGKAPRPLAIEAVETHLRAVPDSARFETALHLAESCYECFSVEEMFRRLIDAKPDDYDEILTVLVDLDIQFAHIQDHWRKLRPLLRSSTSALDKAMSKIRSSRR